MKKIFLTITAILISGALLSVGATPTYSWISIGNNFELNGNPITSSFTSLGSLISVLLQAIFTIAGLTVIIFFLFGGIKFLTSSGDQKAIQSAKDTLTNAFLGIIIIFVSYWVVQIIQTITGVSIL
ncbi:MAG: hypothetical protein M1150_03755 [Patescibacteria group bacterium]|nr:hypothetical protein [Patescibacteria group bacterium]